METNNKNFGGNHMSLIKSAARRLSLLAGSSLAIAGAVSMSSALTVFMPTAAYAYDECAPVAGTGTQSDGPGGLHDPTINGNAPDTFRCTTRPASIAYNSSGTTGLLTIDFVSSNPANGFGSAAGTIGGMQLNSGGNSVLNLGANTVLFASPPNYGLNATIAANTITTINMADNALNSNLETNAWIRNLRATGAGSLVINNDGYLSGNIDLSGLTGSNTMTITGNGAWYSGWQSTGGGGTVTGATTVLAAGNDTINVEEGGIVIAGAKTALDASTVYTHVMDFRERTGDFDVFNLEGHLVVNHGRQNLSINPRVNDFAGMVRMDGLEEFRHSGVIRLGGQQRTTTSQDTAASELVGDGWYDDVLSMPGATFIGEDGQIFFDVNFNAGAQTNCTTRNADGDLAAADCLMIVGGATEGRSFVVINDVHSGDRGSHNPEGIVIVDVSGGTSAQGHFVIDPASDSYDPSNGGIIDKGVFFYGLAYDETSQQHKLVGLVGGNGLQQPILASAAQDLWRLSTASWLERQTDLRGDLERGIGGGVWLRVAGENVERDREQVVEHVFTFDNTVQQNSYAVTGGLDIMSAYEGDTAFVAGVMAGYANSELEYDGSPNQQRFNGWTGGLYASLVTGGFFVDAAFNANKLTLRQDIPSLGLEPAGTLVSTDLVSVGWHVQGGYKIALTGGAFIEPLAGLAYVRTEYDDLVFVPDDPTRVGATAEFDDPVSIRASVGGRFGLEQDYRAFRAELSLLGRVWNEFQGENTVVFHNLGPDATVIDDYSGQFTEAGLGLALHSAAGAVSGFLNVGGKFGDDYDARTASVGVRVAW